MDINLETPIKILKTETDSAVSTSPKDKNLKIEKIENDILKSPTSINEDFAEDPDPNEEVSP